MFFLYANALWVVQYMNFDVNFDVSCVNGTDIRTSCSPHPLIVVILAGLNALGLQSKLLITPFSE